MSAREVINELKETIGKPIQVCYISSSGQTYTRLGAITKIIDDVGFYMESSPHERKMSSAPRAFISFLSCEVSDWNYLYEDDPEWHHGTISQWSVLTQWKAQIMSIWMNKADVMQRIFK